MASPSARVAKLVDARDLKSLDHYDRAGSSPASGTIDQIQSIDILSISGMIRPLQRSRSRDRPLQDIEHPASWRSRSRDRPLQDIEHPASWRGRLRSRPLRGDHGLGWKGRPQGRPLRGWDHNHWGSSTQHCNGSAQIDQHRPQRQASGHPNQ